MITISANGAELSLDITNYQFPTPTRHDEDAAWLRVAGRASCDQGSWSFSDPCMTSSELTTLASWLIHVATLHESSEISFLEPCLSFKRDAVDPLGTIVVTLAHEACPPWIAGEDRYDGYELRIATTVENLETAGRHALSLADRFPDRRQSQ
jgi:hypothetical protein